jgi:hypothetical protein
MSATRTEAHTLTTREVMKMFEAAGIPRAQRSIERYCQQGDLDCLPDAIERRQYITQASVDTLIGQLKELAARHQKTNAEPMSPTDGDDIERRAATTATSESVKHSTLEKREEKHAIGDNEERMKEMEARIKELENEKFNLGLDHGIGHFMLVEVDSEVQAAVPPMPKSPQTSSAASDRKIAPQPSSHQAV